MFTLVALVATLVAAELAPGLAAPSSDAKASSSDSSSSGGRTVSYNYSLSPACSPNNTQPGLSWCRYNNPFILSDFLSRNSTDFTVSSTDRFKIKYHCHDKMDENGHPGRVCSAIQQIGSGTVGPVLRSDDMLRYVTFVDSDGQLLFVYFNENQMAETRLVGVSNVSFFDTAEVRIGPDDDPQQVMVALIGNTSAGGLQGIYPDGRPMPVCHLFTGDATEGGRFVLNKLEFFPKVSIGPESLVSLLWIWAPNNAQFFVPQFNRTITMYRYQLNAAPVREKDIVNYIHQCANPGTPVGVPMGIQTMLYGFADTPMEWLTYQNTNTSLAFSFGYSKRGVVMYRTNYSGWVNETQVKEWGDTLYFNYIGWMVDWCSPRTAWDFEKQGADYRLDVKVKQHNQTLGRQPSTIFCVPNEETEITSMSVFSPDSFTDIGPYRKDIWIAVGLRNRTHTYMHMFDLLETAWMDEDASTLLDPLGLGENFNFTYPCNFDIQARNPNGDCIDRFLVDYVFSDELDGGGPGEAIKALQFRAVWRDMGNLPLNTSGFPTNWSFPNGSFPNGSLPNGSFPWQHNHSHGGEPGGGGDEPHGPPDWIKNMTIGGANMSGEAVQFPIVDKEHIVAFVARGRTVHVFTIYGADPEHYKHQRPPVLIDLANDIQFLGRIQHFHASWNAQHIFAAVERNEWELLSQERYKQICDKLVDDPLNPFLRPGFADTCIAMPPQDININSFTQYASYCTFNTYCPTLERVVAQIVDEGTYADRPAVKKQCPRGYFCPMTGQKMQCPPGFYCPDEGMTSPIRCPASPYFNETCSSFGLTAPQPCPPGSVCFVTHIPGIPAPPGMMMPIPFGHNDSFPNATSAPGFVPPSFAPSHGGNLSLADPLALASGVAPAYQNDPPRRPLLRPENPFVPCPPGWWCTLGAQEPYVGAPNAIGDDTFVCPANTLCGNASVLTPTICDCGHNNSLVGVHCEGMPWCPAGTHDIRWCPAGFYCESPNASRPCMPTQYCPEGTFAPGLCPAGSVCPNASVILDCPAGHYCPRGSVVPVKCNFLTVCPAGSSSESRSFLAPVVLVLVVIGVLVGCSAYTYIKTRESEWVDSIKAPSSPRISDGSVGRPMPMAGGAAVAAETASLLSHNMSANEDPFDNTSIVPTSRFKTPTIRFDGMSLTLNVGEAKGKRVLDDVTGTIPPGSFVAVMGPSGSGKSTFMHTLAGKAFYGTRTGVVTLNGDEVDLTSFSKVTGFVKQDDIMLREMTVQETLLFNARMRCDRKEGSHSPEEICNAMLTALDLNHVRGTNIGDEKKRGISGGQRKRVNVGMEMCALPCVLFLDEPTSGLDSTSSLTVCSALREMAASGGVTVIAVIHQPRYEIFQMFHKVLLLAKGGKNVFYGSPADALPYFQTQLNIKCPEHVNPPDFFMDVISGEKSGDLSIDDMQAKWKAYSARAGGDPDAGPAAPLRETFGPDSGDALAAAAAGKEMAGFFAQLRLFAGRSVVQLSRDLVWFFTDLALVLVSGFFLGLVFSKSEYRPPLPTQIVNKSLENFKGSAPPSLVLYFQRPIDDPIVSEASLTMMAIGMTGVTAALRVFGNEQIVYWREASAGMSTSAYFLAKNFTHIFFIVLSPLLYLAPFLTFVSARASLLEYYWVCVLCQFTTTGLGYLISTVAPPGLSQLAGVVVVLVFAMFGGSRPTLVEIKEMFPLLRVMPYLSYIRWAQEAMYLTEIEKWNAVEGVDINPSLQLFDYHLDDYYLCMLVTAAFGVGFRILALIAMSVMNRHQKH